MLPLIMRYRESMIFLELNDPPYGLSVQRTTSYEHILTHFLRNGILETLTHETLTIPSDYYIFPMHNTNI